MRVPFAAAFSLLLWRSTRLDCIDPSGRVIIDCGMEETQARNQSEPASTAAIVQHQDVDGAALADPVHISLLFDVAA